MTESVVEHDEGSGCRNGVLAALTLIAFALVAGGVGLSLIVSDGCAGACESAALALFYAAAPASALFGVLGGGIPIAWPLDIGVWILLGLGVASWTSRRSRPPWQGVVVLIGVALVVGVGLSQLVEIDRTAL